MEHMERKSEYFAGLSVDSQRRYEQKVLASALSTDPYAIEDCYWTEAPETVPDTQWNDMMVCSISLSMVSCWKFYGSGTPESQLLILKV